MSGSPTSARTPLGATRARKAPAVSAAPGLTPLLAGPAYAVLGERLLQHGLEYCNTDDAMST